MSSSKAMSLDNPEGNTSKASHSHMDSFFKDVNIPNPSGTCFIARHLEKLSSSKALRLFNPEGKTSKASHSHMPSFFKQVNVSNPSGTCFKARYLKKLSSSKATRLLNPEGNTSKASYSHMLSFFKHVNVPNPCGICFKARHLGKMSFPQAMSLLNPSYLPFNILCNVLSHIRNRLSPCMHLPIVSKLNGSPPQAFTIFSATCFKGGSHDWSVPKACMANSSIALSSSRIFMFMMPTLGMYCPKDCPPRELAINLLPLTSLNI